jgi:hypothetical protein
MSAVERLRRTGQYVGEVASRSVGIGIYRAYKQVDNIKEQLGRSKSLQIEEVMVTVFYTLTPVTILALSKEDKSSESKTIQSKFIAGAKFLGAVGVDLSAFATPIAVEAVTHNPLYFLGLLGKPFVNAMVHVTSDVMEARAFKRKDLPRGPEGTYDLLQEAYKKNYDPHLRIGVIKDPQGAVKAVVRKEEICAESGGSCMVLYVPIIDGEKRSMGYAHVTEKDVVVSIGASTGYYEDDPNNPPSIEELIGNLKKPELTVSS